MTLKLTSQARADLARFVALLLFERYQAAHPEKFNQAQDHAGGTASDSEKSEASKRRIRKPT